MLKNTLIYSLLLILLASCSSIKSAFPGNQQTTSAGTASTNKKETKFIEGISMTVESPAPSKTGNNASATNEIAEQTVKNNNIYNQPGAENLSELQLKYAVLLNTPAEEVRNTKMFEFIDEWYGTPYRYGGTTKKGIDCSAFSQYLFSAVYSISLPRTAREQYNLTNRISRTELKEGDLLFFNTRGGVSHVGVYLQNNKFVHSSTSGGVMISDVFDQYWVKRFIGVGRLKNQEVIASGK